MTTQTRIAMEAGLRMTQAEFHARYKEDPAKIELLEEAVHRRGSVRLPHGQATSALGGILGLYEAATPGLVADLNVTVILDEWNEPQPDAVLRRCQDHGGASDTNEEDFLVGPCELIVEVADQTAALDLGDKRRIYQAAGVLEYLVYVIEPAEIHWFHFPSKKQLRPNRSGHYKSRVFPGLWLDGPALIAQNSAALVATLQQGLASAEHAAFVTQFAEHRTQ